jgi:hypothetical protein
MAAFECQKEGVVVSVFADWPGDWHPNRNMVRYMIHHIFSFQHLKMHEWTRKPTVNVSTLL